jgi:DNA polymerase-3 subunit beta
MDVPAPESADSLRPAILSREFVLDACNATSKGRDAFKHVRLAISPDHVRLTDWDGNTIEGALIDGTFPDYARVVPRGEPQHGTATIAHEPFLKAVAAATAFARAAGDNRAALRFAFAGDKLTISAAFDACGSPCQGSATITVNIAASTMAEPRDVGFCGPQVLDILRSLRGRQVRIDFFDVGGPNTFAGDEAEGSALHVIMPVRV